MSCSVEVLSPITGEEIVSKTWNDINAEVLNEDFADKLFAQTRSEQFKSWFGDVYQQGESHSQVVTENGEPLVVYHGSMENFDEFNLDKSKEIGFHFGDKKTASDENLIDFTLDTDINVKPYFLNIRNMIEGVDHLEMESLIPNDMTDFQFKDLHNFGTEKFSIEFTDLVMAFYFKGLISNDQINEIFRSGDKNEFRKALGNPDGYWYINKLENAGEKSYVVFDPKNIKSIYNSGEYSQDENTLMNLKEQGYYKSIPENVLNALRNNGVLSRVINGFGDRWYFVRGFDFQQQNINDNLQKYHQFMSMNNLNQDMFILDNTKFDGGPYLEVNPKFDFKDTIQENSEKIHKEKYEALINFFQDKFGINKDRIVYTSKEEFKKRFPEEYKENMQSVYRNGKFYFFTRNLTSDITVEELLHPFIYTVLELNPELFANLLKEAQLHYPKLNAKIQALYSNKSKSIRDQELVTQALSRIFNNVYENEEPKSFAEIIKDFVRWVAEIMNDIFKYFQTGKYVNVPIESLPVQTSMYEIAKLLNATDTRFDIIYPDLAMYSLEENTADFNKIVESILTDQRVETKVNEILVKLPQTLKDIRNKLNNTINENEKKNLQGIIKNLEQLEDEDSQNLIGFQLKGIMASVQLSNELIKNLNSMANSNYDDNVKLSYYMSVYKTAKAMDGFKELITELKDELSSGLVLNNANKDINTFIAMLGRAISSEDEISSKIQKLVKAPLLNKLVESSEYTYSPKLQDLKTKIKETEEKINKTAFQIEKDKLFNKLIPLRKELKALEEKAPTRENLEKIINGAFKDANILSHIFESKIANGNPLVATLQNIINDIYDSAGRNILNSKNEAQTMMDKYSKATGSGLRDQDKRYEQIRDIIAIPLEIKIDEDTKQPILDDNGNHQFEYVNQDTLLSEIDNSYITQYLESKMIKEFYLDKHKDNVFNDRYDEATYNKYKAALEDFQKFVNDNSEKEYTQEIYDFKAIMNEVIGGKTLREITGNLYEQLDTEQANLEHSTDSDSVQGTLDRIKDIHIELKRLRTIYDENGNKKEGDALKIAELLTKYNKLRNEYYTQNLSDSARARYEFDLEQLEKKKQQYLDLGVNGENLYNSNLRRVQEEIISPDYYTALKSISGELNELNNVLAELAGQALPQYIDNEIFKQQKKDVYEEIRELSKPYRDEDGVVDGQAMTKRHPEVALHIKELQQYIEDLRYETANIATLSIAEKNELSDLSRKENRTQDEQDRLASLITKQKDFSMFKKQNEALLKQIRGLYKQLGDLTAEYTTDYYDAALQDQLDNLKLDKNLLDQARDFIGKNLIISMDGISYYRGGEDRDPNIWYRKQTIGKKSEFIPLDNEGDSGYNEITDLVVGYLAKLSLEDSSWWKDNHYTINKYNEKTKKWEKEDSPIYIWKHQTPRNPNFVETKPAKQYYNFAVKPEYISRDFKTTYRGIPFPKKGKFQNEKYRKLRKDDAVFEFLEYFTKEYLSDQALYDAKGDSVKMGFVLPSINKTSGENAVNFTNNPVKSLQEIFAANVGATDTDTSYLVGGSQSNNKAIPIRFVGKMDTKRQSKDMVAALLLFKYQASLYRALNDSLPVFEASQLLAANVDVLEKKSYADKLSFLKKIKNIFTPQKSRNEETRVKDIEKSVLSKSVDDILDIFVYGQRMKPQILNLGPFGNVDLAKVSSGILGFAAKSIFVGNIISAINNSLSTRLQVIINSGVKSNLYSLKNLRNAQAKAPKYTANLLSDWTKLGNKSLIGQVLDYFSFLNENPTREITSKSEFTFLKNKMEFLTSPKQMSEFEVLFIQFLTIADATPIKINGVLTKLSNIEEIFEIKDGKFKMKDGVEFTKQQEKLFRGRYQSLARKVAGAYRTTEISSIETNWAGKSGMFLRRYFVSMLTNRFQGTRFSFQEGDVYTGYQTEVLRNIGKLFTQYKLNLPKYWNQLSDKEKGSHLKMLTEYGLLIVLIGLFRILGGEDPKKDLKNNSWAYNMNLVALLRAKSELQQFTLVGIDDLIRVGKNPFMVFQTLGNVFKTISLIGPTIWGGEDAFYKQNTGLHKKGDSKLLATFLKTIGYTGVTWSPEEYIVNFRNTQNR